MSAQFVAASSQVLSLASPQVVALPLTVACWFYVSTLPSPFGCLWALEDSANASDDGWYVAATSGRVVVQQALNSVSGNAANTTVNQWALNSWNFVVARYISATNRRLSVLLSTGLTEHVQSVTSITPNAAANASSLGGTSASTRTLFLDGLIAEHWITNSDIQADGLALTDNLLRQLAYFGPFSVPRLAKNIVDYRSLRSSLGSDQDNLSDYYSNGGRRKIWTNINGVIRGFHPQLATGYRGPSDIVRTGIV